MVLILKQLSYKFSRRKELKIMYSEIIQEEEKKQIKCWEVLRMKQNACVERLLRLDYFEVIFAGTCVLSSGTSGS